MLNFLGNNFCGLDPEIGFCLTYYLLYFYNATSIKCEKFGYGGCGGNRNKFAGVDECQRVCGQ